MNNKNELDSNEFKDIKKGDKDSFKKSLFEWVDSFVISFVAIVILFTFFLGKVRVDGNSMKETLHNDDQLIITDFMYTPKRGDIIIISRNPENEVVIKSGTESEFEDQSGKQPIVKRVIAIEGDTIEITKDGKVLLNDKELDEPYIKDYVENLGTEQKNLINKETVPKGRIFVMGDNRWDSHDSRDNDIWMVDKRYVLGKVLLRIYPFDLIKTF